MTNDHRLSDGQREAIDALTSAPRYAGQSKIRVFMQLPAREKPQYFREHFLVPCLAALVVVALCAFVVARLVAPPKRPALYAAVVDTSLPLGESAKLERAVEDDFGEDVVVDDYFDTKKDGLSKLQTMIANEQIDVVVAPPAVFEQLASYGYFANLSSAMPAADYGRLHAYAADFRGFDDSSLEDDVDDSGSGKGAPEPYGLRLDDAALWHRYAQDDDMLVGIVANTRQEPNARRFIDALYR